MKPSEIPFLYHYQPFDEVRLRAILTNNSIYCSNPEHFNDPWDSKPFFDTTCYEDERERAVLAEYLQGGGGRYKLEDVTCETASDYARDTVWQISFELQVSISHHYRIYCLSPNPDINLMWSHYADGHKGICLQFSTRNEVFATAQAVEYSTKYPQLRIEANAEASTKLLLAKSADWQYESEYRIIAIVGEDPPPETTGMHVTQNNRLKLPLGSLTSIIVGCRCDLGAISKLVDECSPGLRVQAALRSPCYYKLKVMRVEP